MQHLDRLATGKAIVCSTLIGWQLGSNSVQHLGRLATGEAVVENNIHNPADPGGMLWQQVEAVGQFQSLHSRACACMCLHSHSHSLSHGHTVIITCLFLIYHMSHM